MDPLPTVREVIIIDKPSKKTNTISSSGGGGDAELDDPAIVS